MTTRHSAGKAGLILLSVFAALVTGCTGGSVPSTNSTSCPSGSPVSLPEAPSPAPLSTGSGAPMRALWQGAPFGRLVVSGGLVLGVVAGQPQEVRALDAVTGALVWSAPLPGNEPDVAGLVPGSAVVIVEVGHCSGTPAGWSVVAEDIALDMRTGRQLWTTPVPGRSQAPTIAVAGDLLVTGDATGTLTARQALTGAVVWQRPRPSGCQGLGGNGVTDEGVGVAADGTLLAASFECQPGHLTVQRLTASNGQVVWQWESPTTSSVNAPNLLSVVGAARQGSLILLSGQIAPPAAAKEFVRGLPSPYTWPTSLGPTLDISVTLALDAQTGKPRWTEEGGQLQDFTLSAGVACETVRTGLECRDDVTGAFSRPVVLTGRGEDTAPPYLGDRFAGISGSIAALIMGSPSRTQVPVVVIPVHGGSVIAQTTVTVGATVYGGGNPNSSIVAAGPLPDGGTLLLLRRVDLPGCPVLAIRVAAAGS